MKTLPHRNTGRIFFYAFSAIVVSLFAPNFALYAAQPRPDWKTEWETTQRAAQKEGRLVVYGPPGVDQQRLYTEIFQQTFPKIKVNYTPGRMSEIMSRIMAEQRAGMRQADLVLGGTDSLLGTLKEKGFLQPIRPVLVLPEILDTAAWFKGKLWFADKEDKFIPMWRAVPYTAACVNTNLVKPNELKSYWDLLQPKWKGKIISQDLRVGSARNQMYTLYARKDLGPEYLKRLYSEMDVTLSRNLPQIADWVAGGKFAIAIGGVDCDDLAAKGLPVVPIHLEGVAAVGAGTDPASWLASSPNTNAAKVFLNWILSRDGQTQFQKLTRENSLRVDIPKEGIVNPFSILDPKREYLFTGLEEYKDKINDFRPWLEALVTKK
ncbi:MAG TPA: extracellular solute-binding protein [Candidatus Limnocylindrales bacterium]|nr:extracellular solute-binding protein [Candidatus Limnocylindrales bacterium]